MTAHAAITIADVWDAHTLHCKARGYVNGKGEACIRKCRGSHYTAELRCHAARVLSAMGGLFDDTGARVIITATILDSSSIWGVSPLTGEEFRLIDGQSDRAIPGAMGGRYDEYNVVMVPSWENLARNYATHDVDAYARDVRRASARVIASRDGIVRGKYAVTPSIRDAVRGRAWKDGEDVSHVVADIEAGRYKM